ncbi:MAG TPA: hypothetical protein IAC04_03515 [Candidatus Coprenecus stercoravium]|uniref:Lipoprotein n=1 Tax=Candidatus Coprenecus stercoravium TaxID=2840735 RepID=A0A9D2GRB5_9BACT|nr:hypothetical protein [Candidatus Coprenecus stercoravium]
MRTQLIKAALFTIMAVMLSAACTDDHRKSGSENPDDPFLGNTTLGFYAEGTDSLVYETDKSQYAIIRQADGNTFSFRILTLNPAQHVTFSGIPAGMKEGDTFEARLSQNFSKALVTGPMEFSVRKISDNTAWLYNQDKKYGIILKTE